GLTPLALEGASYREQLGALARGLRAALIRHPNVVALFATRPVRAPEALVAIAAARAALERAGFAPDVATQAVTVVGVFTLGHVLGEVQGEARSPDELPGGAAFDFGLEVILDGLSARLGTPQSIPHTEVERRTE